MMLSLLLGLLTLWPIIDATAAEETDMNSAAIDQATMDKWSMPYRGWHYWPDHVISSEPKIPGHEDFKNTDVPCVY